MKLYIFLFFLFFQTPGVKVHNDTQFVYLLKLDNEIVKIWPGEELEIKDSLVFFERLDPNYVRALGWGLIKEKISEVDYLSPCLVNNTSDTLLITHHRISFLINPGERICQPTLFVNSKLLLELEINIIRNNKIEGSIFKVIKASQQLELIIAP